ncbi:hypothetical protein L1049_015660 [Liquidambar formosana]|uniref:MADS-box domain-containing protein n=1 Tax=Liquidambar formosana TaxID=63359 RepID=A0AAP0RYG0_LIQFO
MARVRKSKGRQKIEMAKMSKESNLLVTFSKRRSGLFKKASELSTLCGAEVCLIVFSPGKKVFSFGHPCVESIIDRFLTRNPAFNSGGIQHHLMEVHRNASVRDLNMQLTHLLEQLEAEKKRGETLDQIKKASQTQCWWETPIGELGSQHLQLLKAAFEELKQNISRQANRLLIEASTPAPFLGPNSVAGAVAGAGVVSFDNNGVGYNPNGHNFGYGHGFF